MYSNFYKLNSDEMLHWIKTHQPNESLSRRSVDPVKIQRLEQLLKQHYVKR